jgi:flagellar protein FlaF
LQSICDAWSGKAQELDDALVYNRKLWSVFLTSVTRDDNPLPREIKQNIANLGMFVMKQTVSLGTDPKPERVGSIISINRQLAAGLMSRA